MARASQGSSAAQSTSRVFTILTAALILAVGVVVGWWRQPKLFAHPASQQKWYREVPHLAQFNEEALSVKPLSGGLSNRNFRIDISGSNPQSFVLRVPGDVFWGLTDRNASAAAATSATIEQGAHRRGDHRVSRALLGMLYWTVHRIDRRLEHTLAQSSANTGFSPKVVDYVADKGLILTEFVSSSRVLTSVDFRHAATLQRVIQLLHRFHRTIPPQPLLDAASATLAAFAELRSGGATAGASSGAPAASGSSGSVSGSKPSLPAFKSKDLLYSPLVRSEARLAFVLARHREREHAGDGRRNHVIPVYVSFLFHVAPVIDDLIRKTAPSPRHAAIHGDVVPANFLLGPSGGYTAETDRLWMVDFEYAGVGDPYWDLVTMASLNKLSADEEDHILDLYLEEELAFHYGKTCDRKGFVVRDSQTNQCDFTDEFRAFVWARHHLMKFLINIQEGMWGLSMHEMVGELAEFSAEWTDFQSYWDYGVSFLDAAAAITNEAPGKPGEHDMQTFAAIVSDFRKRFLQ